MADYQPDIAAEKTSSSSQLVREGIGAIGSKAQACLLIVQHSGAASRGTASSCRGDQNGVK